MRIRRHNAAVVTDAARSRHDEFSDRRARYLKMMALRLGLLVVAAYVSQYSVFWAIVVGLASAVVPWFAVVMANDGPPKDRRADHRVTMSAPERALEAPRSASDRRVITAGPVLIDEHGATLRDRAC